MCFTFTHLKRLDHSQLQHDFEWHTRWMNTRQACALGLMNIRQVLARNMRRLRRERGLSQEALAGQVDINRTYVSDLERCVYSATIDMVERLGKELGVEAADLLRR